MIRAGNIVQWNTDKTSIAVVRRVCVPSWEKNKVRYARCLCYDLCMWIKADELILIQDFRSKDKREQIEKYISFTGQKIDYIETMMREY